MAPDFHGSVEADIALIDSLLRDTPEWTYRCPNTNCAYEGNAAVHVFNEHRKVDESRCPTCDTWISNGVPIVKAERVIHEADRKPLPPAPADVVEGELVNG